MMSLPEVVDGALMAALLLTGTTALAVIIKMLVNRGKGNDELDGLL